MQSITLDERKDYKGIICGTTSSNLSNYSSLSDLSSQNSLKTCTYEETSSNTDSDCLNYEDETVSSNGSFQTLLQGNEDENAKTK